MNNTYMVDGNSISTVSQAKYLGLIITSNLSWNAHIDSIVYKASKRLGFLRCTLRHSTTNTKLSVYTTLVRLILDHGDIVWDPHTSLYIQKVE